MKGKSIYLTQNQIELLQVIILNHNESLPFSDFYKEEEKTCNKILDKLSK
jgi:hypothetical protein